jgi:hypothetical protein
MESYIHRENLALFNKRLEEAHTDEEREVLLRLIAEEKAKAARGERNHESQGR